MNNFRDLFKRYGSRQKQMALANRPSSKLASRTFEYTPLDISRHEIRLLSVLPSPNDTDHISCILNVVSLDDEPRYSALSYVWGPESDEDEDITVNGQVLYRARANLVLALRYFRRCLASTVSNESPLNWLWVDAVCINQQDIPEKNQQINLMPVLYSGAKQVISWLGGGDESLFKACDFIKNVVQAAKSSGGHSKPSRKRLTSSYSINNIHLWKEDSGEKTVDPRLLLLFSLSESVIDLFLLPYWHRVWVVQEVVLASEPECNIVVCGNEVMTFRDIQIFRNNWLALLRDLQLDREWTAALSKTPAFNIMSDSWPEHLKKMEESLVVWSYYDFIRGLRIQGDSLFYILLAPAYQCIDPRDSVYGLLNVVSSARLVPNYELSSREVYTHWFLTVLKDWQNTEPLYFSGLAEGSKIEGLPSWVPDLSLARKDSPVWDATLAGTIETGIAAKDFGFGGRGLPEFPILLDGNKVLSTKGIICDVVADTNPIYTEYPGDSMASFCATILRQRGKTYYRTGMPILQVTFRVLMCGINRFNAVEKERQGSLMARSKQLTIGTSQLHLNATMPLLQAVTKTMLARGHLEAVDLDDFVLEALCQPSPTLGIDITADFYLAAAFIAVMVSRDPREKMPYLPLWALGLPYGCSNFQHEFIECFSPGRSDLEPLITPQILEDGRVKALVNSIERYFETYEHTFFFTASGLLGNGPRSIEAGDHVVVLEGAKMPFVVRKVGDNFLLVGTCYVEGISDGEPAAMARRGELQVDEIRLV
jgi:hypothetical protein